MQLLTLITFLFVDVNQILRQKEGVSRRYSTLYSWSNVYLHNVTYLLILDLLEMRHLRKLSQS